MKLTVGMVLYEPQWESLLERLNTFTSRLWLLDNSASPVSVEHRDAINELSSVTYQWMGANVGICKAYNVLLDQLDSSDWLLTLDQDSLADQNFVDRLVAAATSFLKDHHPKPENQESWTGFPMSDMNGRSSRQTSPKTDEHISAKANAETISSENWVGAFVSLPRTHDHDPTDVLHAYETVPFAISSGSLHYLPALRRLGGFDEKFWLDGFDHDFCLGARRLGYSIVRCNGVVLPHSLGEPKKVRPLFGKKTGVIFEHHPWRNRLIARNRRILWAKYRDQKAWIKQQRYQELRDLARIFVYEEKKLSKCWGIFRGILDYYMGKRGAPQYVAGAK